MIVRTARKILDDAVHAFRCSHIIGAPVAAIHLVPNRFLVQSHYSSFCHLREAQIVRPELRIWDEGPLSIYYVPFERVNPDAKVFLVGLTPGRHQMWKASMAASKALRAGFSIPDALTAASMSGGFAGSMRTNLVSMLDQIGVAEWLGIASTCQI